MSMAATTRHNPLYMAIPLCRYSYEREVPAASARGSQLMLRTLQVEQYVVYETYETFIRRQRDGLILLQLSSHS